MAVAGPVSAETVSATVNPVPVGNVPVQVCVNTTCTNTPPLSTVGLNATATANNATSLPVITPGTCASGTGGTLVVEGGSSGATVEGVVTGTLPDGSGFSQPIPPVTVAPGGTTTISACTTSAPSLPPLPGLPPPPGLPPTPSPAGLIGLILNLITSLLGGGLPV